MLSIQSSSSNAFLAPLGAKNEATDTLPSHGEQLSAGSSDSFANAILQRTLKRIDDWQKSVVVMRQMVGELVNQKNMPAAAKALGEQIEKVRQSGLLARQEQAWLLTLLSSEIEQRSAIDGGQFVLDKRDALAGLSSKIASDLSKVPGGVAPREMTTNSSFDDILDGLQDLIGIIKDDYLDVYASMVKQYADMYSDFNEQIMAMLGDWTKFPQVGSGSDADRIAVDVVQLGAALDALIAKYSLPNSGAVLFPPPENGSVSGASLEDAQKWLEAMGLPASCLKQAPGGGYCVVMDISPLTTMKANLPAANSGSLAFMNPAVFQAWQSGFNSQQQEMESALQQHTQKYSNANSIHDNVQKTISSTISTLIEMLKAFSAALG